MDKKCFCCKKPGKFSILLCGERGRIYIPNQYVRAQANEDPDNPDNPMAIWFCSDCMRKIEDNLRATVQYLKHEVGIQAHK